MCDAKPFNLGKDTESLTLRTIAMYVFLMIGKQISKRHPSLTTIPQTCTTAFC